MPVYRVKGPDGRTFKVNAPEGASSQDAIRYIYDTKYGSVEPAAEPAAEDDYYEQLYGSAQAAQTAPAEEKSLGGFWDTFFERMKTIPSLADEAAAFAANPTEESRKAFVAAGDSKFRGVGFGEGENWAAFKQLLGGSLGQMVAPVAAATAGSFATPFAGVAAGFGTSATQYEIQNLLRQAQEQERAAAEGRTPQELELGKSIAASAAQAGLDVVQFKYFEKLFRALPFTRNLLLPEKEAAQRAADELVDSYKAGRLRTTPMGTVKDAAKGAAFEVPQELAQTVLERWQAGLSLSDDEAQEEYKQAAIGAAILGPLMGGAAGAVGRRGERIAAQEEIERREAAAGAGTTPPVPPTPPEGAPPEGSVPEEPTGAAQFEYSEQGVLERSRALGRSIRLQRLRQARPDLDTTTLDYLIEEGYTNKQILDYNKPTRAGREPLSIESYKAAAEEAAPTAPPAPADVEVATEDLVATEAAPAPDVRNLALEAIKTTPTIKAISEATGLNQPKAAAIMNGFVDEGLVERKGNKFKLVEAAKPEEVAAAPEVEAAAPAVMPAPPTTPPEAPRGTAPEPAAEEAVAEPVGRGAELPVPRPAPEGRAVAEPRGEGLGVPSEAAVRADERAAGVEPALTTAPAKNARAAGLEYVRSTGKADALGLQKATGLKLSEAKVLREALVGSGAIVPVPGKANLYTVAGEYAPTATARRVEAAETTTDEAAIEAARDRAAARLRAKGVEKEAAEAAADLASERAPAPKLRPTFKGTPKGELSEDVRRAFAQLEAEEAAKKKPKEAEAQQGLDLLGGMAKPSLSRAEIKVLDDIKSAARYLNSSGQMNDQDRATYNAEISKPSPNLKKLRKLVDKVSSREPDAITEVERDEAFDTDREQYELDEETYFYDRPDEYTRRGELKPLKFRRGEGRGLPANKVSEVVNGIIKGWKNAPKINVVQSVDELPGQNFPNTQGVYANGQVYLVANNLNNDAEVKGTLFHEALGHFGLEQLFGSRLKEVMLDLYRTNKALQRQADQYLEMFPDTYAGETREDQIAFAVEEVIAEASAAGPKAKDASALRAAFNRVANLIRRFLNAMGFPVTYTNKEINEILIQAHGSVVAGQRKDRIGDGSIKYQRRRAEERLSTVLDVNISAPPYTNKVGDGVRSAFGSISDSLRQAAMGFLQVKDTAEIWKNDLPEIQTTDKILESRGGTEAARREEVNDHVVKWYKMSNKVSKKDPDMMNHFFKIANLTTVYQVDPLSDIDRAVLTKPVSKMDGQDRAAYDIIKEYDALPEDLRNTYKELRQFYEQKSAQLFELLGKVVGESAVDRLKKKYDSKRLKVYLPLWRKGDYWLTYTDQNNETVTSAFASEIDRKRAIESLRAQGITNAKPFTRLRDARRNGPPPTGFLGEVLSVLEDGGAPEYMVDSVYEAFLNYLPADSIRQQLQSREESYDMATGTTRYGKFGFEPDVLQAFANVATRMANQLTNLEYAVPIEESLKKVREQAGGERITDPVLRDVYENLVKQIDFIRNPQPNRFFDGASYFSYMWFIAGNISSALVNTTQLPLVVAPLLGGKYGYDKAYTAMNNAMKTYFKGGFDTNSDYTFGAAANLDPKYKKLYNTAVSRSIIRRSTGYEFTEARRVSTKDYVGIRAKVEGWLGWTFQNSERFNREVTLLAGFDLAYSRTGDVNAAIEEAIKLTKDAHGSALAETGPRIFQQGFGKMMFTFKRFAQAQVYLLSRLFHQAMKGEDATTREVARSQLVGIFGSSFVLAGVQGMPLYGMAELLASLVAEIRGDDDEPFDPTGYVNEAFTETGRKGLLSQMIGVDIASRTGFNGLLWREDYKRMSDIGPVLYTLEQAMGPAYAAFMGITRGIGLAGEGEYQRAIEAIAPSYIRNAWKTLRYAEDGVRNRDGTPVVEDVGAYNLMMQLVGFAPSEVSYARERASVAAKLEDKLTGRRSSLLDKYYSAWQEQDVEGMQEALEEIKKFNAKNPQKGLAITQSTLRKSIAGRVTRQQQSVDGLYIPMSIRNRIAQILPGD